VRRRPLVWTRLRVAMLRRLYPHTATADVAAQLGVSANTVCARASILGIRKGEEFKGRPRPSIWTPERMSLLRELYPDVATAGVARRIGLRESAIAAKASELGLRKTREFLHQQGIRAGLAWGFPKGHVPANKGLRRPGYSIGRGRMRETQFKKGQLNGTAALNYKPVGTVIVDSKDGYLKRKMCEPQGYGRGQVRGAMCWKFEHVRIWEEKHGPVPRGFCVSFKDGNRRNVKIGNLKLISRAANMRRNSIHARRSPEEKAAIYALIALKRSIMMREKKLCRKRT
jgi:hypothetical protein